VTPGFLDIHTHYDLEVEISPGLKESVRHGVTTVVMGGCSLSVTYGRPEDLAEMFLRVETLPRVLIEKWLARSVNWESPGAYAKHLQSLSLGPSVATMLGHSALRAHVMGLARSLRERATPAELARMRELAEEALDQGCLGISVDMLPWHMMSGVHTGRALPSHYADFREYRMLAEVCRSRDAVFQATPNPQNLTTMFQIFWMSLGIFRKPLRATVLAALDPTSYRHMWRIFPLSLFIFNRLLGCNIRFQTLPEPFTVYSDGPVTPMFEEFPTGVLLNDRHTRAERQALWREPAFRERFRREWAKPWRNTFHRDLTVMHVVSCPDASMVGKTLAQCAQEQGVEATEYFMQQLERYDDDLRWVTTAANHREDVRHALLACPDILPGFSDAGAHAKNLGFYDGALTLLRQAVKTQFMLPERAISRVTGEAAAWFRLDRGVLAPGKVADITVLDPRLLTADIQEQVEYADPDLDGALRMVKPGSRELVSVYISGRLAFESGNRVLKKVGTNSQITPNPA
jgi:N-acyl-D-aspartate/D-glutamate deacylase